MELKFGKDGLIPAVVQDADSRDVLMVAYMNREAFELTCRQKVAWFYSRSRQKLWKKGETSGNIMQVQKIYLDCDNDTVLIKAKPAGPACHTGQYSCFYKEVEETDMKEMETKKTQTILEEVYDVIADRDKNPKEGSYTNYLLEKGIDKMLKKVGEESAEVIIAAKNRSKAEVSYEVADLMYHVSVVLYEQGLTWNDIFEELKKRR